MRISVVNTGWQLVVLQTPRAPHNPPVGGGGRGRCGTLVGYMGMIRDCDSIGNGGLVVRARDSESYDRGSVPAVSALYCLNMAQSVAYGVLVET